MKHHTSDPAQRAADIADREAEIAEREARAAHQRLEDVPSVCSQAWISIYDAVLRELVSR